MKRLLAMAAFLAIAPVLADQEADTLWQKYLIVSTGETEADQDAHLQSHGISRDGAEALRVYVANGQQVLQEKMQALHVEMCAMKDELVRGGPEAFAQAYEKQEVELSETRAELVKGADKVLSPEDAERLDHLTKHDEHGPKVWFHDLGIAALIREGRLPVGETLERICKQ